MCKISDKSDKSFCLIIVIYLGVHFFRTQCILFADVVLQNKAAPVFDATLFFVNST